MYTSSNCMVESESSGGLPTTLRRLLPSSLKREDLFVLLASGSGLMLFQVITSSSSVSTSLAIQGVIGAMVGYSETVLAFLDSTVTGGRRCTAGSARL